MRRSELEHLIRAACELIGDDEIIVIGSQAIHASMPEDQLPAPTTMSNEADLWPIAAEDDSDPRVVGQIEGVLGQDSPFHRTHRVYGDDADVSTATLPDGWEARRDRFRCAGASCSKAKLSALTGLDVASGPGPGRSSVTSAA